MRRRSGVLIGLSLAIAMSAAACGTKHKAPQPHEGLDKIKHIVIVMQENRSFDSYFGTFPGADGIPMRGGVPAVCVPDARRTCKRPYHDVFNINRGGPHDAVAAAAATDAGAMDGFVRVDRSARKNCEDATKPNSRQPRPRGCSFVLQDHMFQPSSSWSLPEHLFAASEWSAACARHDDPASCTNDEQNAGLPGGQRVEDARAKPWARTLAGAVFAWRTTAQTQLLNQIRACQAPLEITPAASSG